MTSRWLAGAMAIARRDAQLLASYRSTFVSRPLGVVLNMVDVSSLRDYSYYYYYAQSGDYGKTPQASQAGSAGA